MNLDKEIEKYKKALESIESFYNEEENRMVIATDSYNMLWEAISKVEEYNLFLKKPIKWYSVSMQSITNDLIELENENIRLNSIINKLMIYLLAFNAIAQKIIIYDDNENMFIDEVFIEGSIEHEIIKKAMDIHKIEEVEDE